MATSSIPVDPLNPGQVFACLGLLEAAEVILGDAWGRFESVETTRPQFHVRAAGEACPVAAVLGFLAAAELTTEAPHRSTLTTAGWSVPTQQLPTGAPFPFPDPSSPATLPAVLFSKNHRIVLDHWGDATRRDSAKFWAGAGGYPGAGLLRDALDLVRDRLDSAASDPFGVAAPQSSSFRFDWRRDYVPLDIGFSLNNHSKITPQGYPLVEILAAIGLSNARPHRPNRRDKLMYRYGVLWDADAPLVLHRAALGCADLPFPTRTFRMALAWPGQENQARCITDVAEETRP